MHWSTPARGVSCLVEGVYRLSLKLRCIEEAKNEWHRKLRHVEEEGAYQRNCHHFVEVDKQVAS